MIIKAIIYHEYLKESDSYRIKLKTFLSVTVYKQKGGQMTNDCEFHVLLLIF